MIIVLKNFKRNSLCNLTSKSIKHFLPDADIRVLCMFKDTFLEYEKIEALIVPTVYYRRSRYTDLGPSVANQFNNLFFSEGYNYIWEMFHDYNGKLLMLAEDHFFTTGETLFELMNTNFDLAYAPWGAGVNGSILCFNPFNVRQAFPIPEDRTTVEHTFMNWINNKCSGLKVHRISTRDCLDYRGDGLYSNDESEIRSALLKASIL